MRALITGSNGFIGRNVAEAMGIHHEVFHADRRPEAGEKNYRVDLIGRETIKAVLQRTKPDIIINCAGVVKNSDEAKLNVLFTTNILQEVIEDNLKLKKIVILGSAAEYGVVREEDIPVREDTQRKPSSNYGAAKTEEVNYALVFAKKHKIPVVVARIFNPIGAGMKDGFLIPNILNQISEFESGNREYLEVSRLDAKRDYIDVRDVALAIKFLAESITEHDVFNIGSGNSTSNEELIKLILDKQKLKIDPKLKETSDEPEPLYAIQADTTRIRGETKWRPKYSLEETIEEIVVNEK